MFAPTQDAYGSDSFTVVAIGPGGTSSEATISVTIGLPPVPGVTDATLSVAFQGDATLDLQEHVSGLYDEIVIVSGPTKGTAAVDGTILEYTASSGAYGPDSVALMARGPGGDSLPMTVEVVISTPAEPTVSSGTLNPDFNSSASLDLGSLISGLYKSVSVTTDPSKGTVALSGTLLTYTPGQDAFGPDGIGFTVESFTGGSISSTIAITIGLPPVPGVTDATLAVGFQSSASLELQPHVSGVYDEIVIVSGPAKGTAEVDGSILEYTASAGEYGSDTLTLMARGPGGDSLPMTVEVVISTPTNPVVSSGTLTPAFNDDATIDLGSLISGLYKSVSITTDPSKGTFALAGTLLTYTPGQDQVGSDEIGFTVESFTGVLLSSTIAIEIETPPLPSVSDGTLLVAFGGNASIDLGDLIGGPFKSLSVAVYSNLSKGVASLTGTVVSFATNENAYGADTLMFFVTGFDDQVALANLAITIGLPPVPGVTDATLAVDFQSSASLDLQPHVSGVYDEIVIVSGPAKGTAEVDGSMLEYRASAGEYGPDSMTLMASGPGGDSLPMTVDIVISTPAEPVVSSGTLTPAFNGSASLDLGSLISGLYRSVSITTHPSKGTVALEGTVLTYTPGQDEVGSDEIGFTVESFTGVLQSSTIAIEIETPALPGVSDATLPVAFGEMGSIDLGDLIDGLFKSLSISQPSKGTASLSGTVLSYTPNVGAYGADTLSFSVTGFDDQIAVATLTIDIALPEAPEVVPTPISTDVSGYAEVDLNSLVSGVYDPASFRIVSGPPKGTFNLSGANFTYTANPGAYGTDSFTFLVSGPGGDTSTTITINLGTPPPVEVEDHVVLLGHNQTGSVDVAEGAKGGPFSEASIMNDPAGGTASATGTVIAFVPEVGFEGRATLGFRLTSVFGTSADATVTFLVGDRPDIASDREVAAIVGAQAQAARQFSTDQVRNFGSRLEFLHRGPGDREDRIADVRLNFAQASEDRQSADDLIDDHGYASGLVFSDLVSGARKTPTPGVHGKNHAIWTGGYVNFGDHSADSIDYSSTTVGVSGGIDYRFSPTFVGGIGFGYGHDSADLGDNGSENKSRAYTAALYGSYHPAGGLFLDGTLGYSWLDFTSRRHVTPTGDFAVGNRSGQQVFGAVTAGHEYRREKFLFSPYLRIEGSHAKLDGFTEAGAGPYDIRYGDQTVSSISGVVGARIEYEFETDFGSVRPSARIEYSHDLDGSSKTTAAYSDLMELPASLEGTSAKNGSFDFGLGFATSLGNGWDVDVEYRHGTGGGSSSHSVMGAVGLRF